MVKWEKSEDWPDTKQIRLRVEVPIIAFEEPFNAVVDQELGSIGIGGSAAIPLARTALKHQRESVMMRYGLGEIPQALMAIRLINRQIQDSPEQEKAGKSKDFPAVVDYPFKLSNFFRLLRVIQARFSKQRLVYVGS